MAFRRGLHQSFGTKPRPDLPPNRYHQTPRSQGRPSGENASAAEKAIKTGRPIANEVKVSSGCDRVSKVSTAKLATFYHPTPGRMRENRVCGRAPSSLVMKLGSYPSPSSIDPGASLSNRPPPRAAVSPPAVPEPRPTIGERQLSSSPPEARVPQRHPVSEASTDSTRQRSGRYVPLLETPGGPKCAAVRRPTATPGTGGRVCSHRKPPKPGAGGSDVRNEYGFGDVPCPVCPSRTAVWVRLFTSHNRTVLSPLPEARVRPSGENDTERHYPISSHALRGRRSGCRCPRPTTEPFYPNFPTARVRPSGENDTELTHTHALRGRRPGCRCPRPTTEPCCPNSPTARVRPSGENATERTPSVWHPTLRGRRSGCGCLRPTTEPFISRSAAIRSRQQGFVCPSQLVPPSHNRSSTT